ncbi:MAG: DNA-3-methyladenine glycosylase I [Lewinellaceae bacterium]|nr:DNA-3-methyladenine glycosylase I [Lewinellaceae bacterium]
MEKPKTYCEYAEQLALSNVHRIYHDQAYGFPIDSDDELFGRLILEINQAGLSWTTILNKQDNFRNAYANFEVAKVARFTAKDRERLLNDAGIIRNRLKVDAAIHNAQKIEELQARFGSFKNWLDQHHPQTKEEWVKLFKKTFRFTGGEITNEFLLSTGYLKGAHEPGCPVYQEILRQKPKWHEI